MSIFGVGFASVVFIVKWAILYCAAWTRHKLIFCSAVYSSAREVVIRLTTFELTPDSVSDSDQQISINGLHLWHISAEVVA